MVWEIRNIETGDIVTSEGCPGKSHREDSNRFPDGRTALQSRRETEGQHACRAETSAA